MINTAVLLAAGRGTRLGDVTKTRPKVLVEVAGRSLLAHTAAALGAHGIQNLVIITGHLSALVEAAVMDLRSPLSIKTVQAPGYIEGGSMGSLLRAAVEVNGPIVLLESDLLYDPGFIAAAQRCSFSTILTADASGSGDEVFVVTTPEGRLHSLGKRLPADMVRQSVGELAGISLLTHETLLAFAQRATAWRNEGRIDAHYEEVLLSLAQEGHAITVKHCAGLAWTEIDTPADLTRATERVWPRIAATQSKSA